MEGCKEWSLKLGYLTGEESEVGFSWLFASIFSLECFFLRHHLL